MKKIYVLFLTTAVMASGCKKFLDVNQNPNQPTAVTANVVLSAGLTGSAADKNTDFLSVTRWMGYYSRAFNYVSDAPTESYNIPNSYQDNSFARLYSTLTRYNYIEQQGHKNNTPFYIGVAKVMKAVHFSTLVDCYGNVPYSKAFDVVNNQQPAYDDAKTIYASLIAGLDSAVIYFDQASTQYALPTTTAAVLSTDDQYDLIFGRGKGGSSVGAAQSRMDNWVKFANSVKLELLMHEVNVIPAATITAEVAKVDDRGYLGAGETASVNPGYQLSTDKISPFFANFNSTTGANNNFVYYQANTLFLNFTTATGDERQYGDYTSPFLGNFDGDPQAVSGTSSVGPGVLKSASQDALIMSDFESLFVQAEAAARGFLPGADGDALLKQAIEQNYVYVVAQAEGTGSDAGDAEVAIADADAYYEAGADNPLVGYNSTADHIQPIITQAWASYNGVNWIEAWTNYRRTGYPKPPTLTISAAPTHVKNAIPYRFLYPQTEQNTNAKNVPALPAAQYTPIFWDTLDK